jgi:hypothetical protein
MAGALHQARSDIAPLALAIKGSRGYKAVEIQRVIRDPVATLIQTKGLSHF